MRKLLSLLVCLLLAGFAVAFAQSSAKTFHGQIMDSACASMGGHTAGYKMTGTHTPKACTLACVKAGSQFVLYNAGTKTTYKLDNQNSPRAFAGENVTVTGTLNPADNTIHLVKIKAVR